MKKFLKGVIKSAVGEKNFILIKAVSNFYADFILFYKYSTVFKVNNIKKKEAKIILDYHSLEKGMLFIEMKPAFAKDRVLRLHKLLGEKEIEENVANSQIQVAYQVICQYYELHREKKIDIAGFYTEAQYNRYREILNKDYMPDFNGIIEYHVSDFYKNNQTAFSEFAFSRKSIRDFTGEKVAPEILRKAIELALSSPSVCNRQASKVYVLQDKVKIDKALNIQSGFRGYMDNVSQLLILTNDRNYYYSVGERNQFYIDGGIFLMNLLYALHYYKIANCPANWGKEIVEEKRLNKVVELPESEKIICMIPIGVPKETFRVTLSRRRHAQEVMHIID